MEKRSRELVEVMLNGEPRQIESGQSVTELVTGLGRHPRTVAVEHNGEILPRADYDRTRLRAGDRIEIVHFVQGGGWAAGERGPACVYFQRRAASSIGRAADS